MSKRSARASRLACLVLAIVGVTAVGVAPVRAACGLTEEAVAAAPAALVGILTAVSADGLTATFQVEEVWQATGIEIGDETEVAIADGGVPATLQMPPDGTLLRFLVLAKVTHEGGLVTQLSCSIFAYPWDASYATFAPADYHPAKDPTPLLEPFVVLGLVLLALAIGMAGAIALRGRAAPSADK